MKIAFLSVFYPYRGGISQFNACLYRALERNHVVKAFNFKRQYPNFIFPGKSQYVAANDTADKIPSERLLDSINPFSYLRTAREIEKYNPDLLLIQHWTPIFAPAFGYIARYFKKRGKPVLSLVANVKPHEKIPFEMIISKFFLNQNNGFILLADAVKNDLLDLMPNAKYFVHPHPNYTHFGEKIEKATARDFLGLPHDKKLLLFFGFIRKYKGFDVLIEALALLPSDYHLLAAGECYGSFEPYDKLISQYDLEQRVHYFGDYLPDDKIAPYFSASDVCILPYRSATQSGITGIAYHFGLPVISTDVGGLKEVIEPFRTGIVIEKAEPHLLASAIEDYFSGTIADEFRSNVGKFSEKYTWLSLADVIIEFAGNFIEKTKK